MCVWGGGGGGGGGDMKFGAGINSEGNFEEEGGGGG